MKIEKIKKLVIQFFKFGIVGAINTILSYAITNAGYYAFHLNEQISNIIAFVITVFISYLLNSKFVFNKKNKKTSGNELNKKDKKEVLKEIVKVYISYSFTGLFLTAILLYLEERVLGIPHYIATLLNLVITIPLNFILNKFWAYKDKE